MCFDISLNDWLIGSCKSALTDATASPQSTSALVSLPEGLVATPVVVGCPQCVSNKIEQKKAGERERESVCVCVKLGGQAHCWVHRARFGTLVCCAHHSFVHKGVKARRSLNEEVEAKAVQAHVQLQLVECGQINPWLKPDHFGDSLQFGVDVVGCE